MVTTNTLEYLAESAYKKAYKTAKNTTKKTLGGLAVATALTGASAMFLTPQTTLNAQTQGTQNIHITGQVLDHHFKENLEGKILTAKDLNGETLKKDTTDQNGYDLNFIITDVKDQKPIQTKFKLEQNYPNPFNPTTQVSTLIDKTGTYTLEEFGPLGNLIDKETLTLTKGVNSFTLSTPSAGVFFYRLSGEGHTQTKKMISFSGTTNPDHIFYNGSNGQISTRLSKTSSTNDEKIWLVATDPLKMYEPDSVQVTLSPEVSQDIDMQQIPLNGTMTLNGNVVAKPTNASPSNVTVQTNNKSTTTNNGAWTLQLPITYITNPADTTQKAYTPSNISITWSGTHYKTATQDEPVTNGTKTINKDLQQTTYNKTATLETLVNDGTNPLSGANIIVKKTSNDSTMATGTTNSNGIKDFNLTYKGYEFDDDATYNNIGNITITADATNYNSSNTTTTFTNPMNETITLTVGNQNITITGNSIDNKFGTVVQDDIATLRDKNENVYATDNNSADGITLNADIPANVDIYVKLTNPNGTYPTKNIDVTEQSQDLGDIIRNQIPKQGTMTLNGNVTAIPTNASPSNVTVQTNNKSTTTNNGAWSNTIDYDVYTNPVDANDKMFDPSTVTITWSGTHYETATQDEPVTNGTKTINKDLQQTTYNKTATLETLVQDQNNNPIQNANVTVKKTSNDSTMATGTTNSNGIKDFNLTYKGYEFDDDATYNNIGNITITADATNYNSSNTTTTFTNPMNETLTLTEIVQQQVLDAYLKLYDTAGRTVTSQKLPSLRYVILNDTLLATNNNGEVHLQDTYNSANPEQVHILPPDNGEYLGTMSITTNNPNKVERLSQSDNQSSGVYISSSTLNDNGTSEIYFIPKIWYYGENGDLQLVADGSTVQSFYGRSPLSGTSGHRPLSPYPVTLVLEGTFHEDTGEQFPQDLIDIRNAQITAYLDATQFPHKKLLDYEVKTFTSWSDPVWTSIKGGTTRNGENVMYSTFGNSDGNGIDYDLNSGPDQYRIFNSNSTTTTDTSPSGRMSEIFSSMTNTQGQMSGYVTTPSTGGDITDAGKNMIGLSYLFKPGTKFWEK